MLLIGFHYKFYWLVILIRGVVSITIVLIFLFLTSCTRKEDSNAIRVCIDLAGIDSSKTSEVQAAFERLVFNCAQEGGPQDVCIEVIPYDGSERASMIERIRTEFISGKGPDIFVVTSSKNDSLFRYPQTIMKRNLLLPLDSYISAAKYMEWDQFNQNVVDIGKYDGEQYLIPLDYSFPVTLYKKNDILHTPSQDLCWQDMLADNSNFLASAVCDVDGSFGYSYTQFISNIFGHIADYDNGELLISEEELYDIIINIFEVNDRDYSQLPNRLRVRMGVLQNAFQNFWFANQTYVEPFRDDDALTMIPMYQTEGGITATVDHYVGINRNTNNPEGAFFILDYLLSRDSQQYSDVYRNITNYLSLPVHNALLSPDYPVFGWNMNQESFQELCTLRNQITCVRFNSVLELSLSKLYIDCKQACDGYGGGNIKDIVHEAYRVIRMDLSES